MNKIAYFPLRFTNYMLLGALLLPVTANATILEQVTTGAQPSIVATGACSKTTDIDLITQNEN
jgi:hypothetical protein